jgi:hypothetical protein
MATQKFMGKGQLIDRLTAQVGNRDTAVKLLQDRGHLKADGVTFTAEGMKRNNMTAAERAIDRATKESKHPKTAYAYDPKTNRAKLKG